MTGRIEPMIGRYVHVDIDGTPHRIYFEEAGAGIPLVCLHTAGSDARQWRYLLADEETRETLIIDPVDTQVDDIVRLLDELHLKLVLSIETHTHADHFSAARADFLNIAD